MRLSDAIRLGSMIRPKVDGYFFHDGKSCALGAALEATGTVYDEGGCKRHRDALRARWPFAVLRFVSCPACGRSMPLAALVAHLNNGGVEYFGTGHDWTREAIADFVATVEPADLPDAPAAIAPPPSPEAAPVPIVVLAADIRMVGVTCG